MTSLLPGSLNLNKTIKHTNTLDKTSTKFIYFVEPATCRNSFNLFI